MSVGTAGRAFCLTASATLLTCALWRLAVNQTDIPTTPTANVSQTLSTTGVGCGAAALMAAVEEIDSDLAQQVQAVLRYDSRASGPVSSLYDLAHWARAAGLEPVGVEVRPEHLSRLPLPAVAHIRPGHFVALLGVGEEYVVVRDQGDVAREIPRRGFDRLFSGFVLCLGLDGAKGGQRL